MKLIGSSIVSSIKKSTLLFFALFCMAMNKSKNNVLLSVPNISGNEMKYVKECLDTDFQKLAFEMSQEPRVLCHRDFHSRNLMVYKNRLYVIDLQDARMGPDTYDLASLLRDSYLELPTTEIDQLLSTYSQVMNISDTSAFRDRFIRGRPAQQHEHPRSRNRRNGVRSQAGRAWRGLQYFRR